MCNKIKEHKKLVFELYKNALGNYSESFAEKYFNKGFTQHNPWAGNGFVNIKNLYMFNFKYFPYRWVVQDDLVACHGLYQLTKKFNDLAIYSVDIWRLDNLKISEHWDVLEIIPYDRRNDYVEGFGNGDLDIENEVLTYNTGLVKSYIDAINNHQIEELDDFLDEEFILHHKNYPVNRNLIKKQFASNTFFHYSIKRIIASGDLVFIHTQYQDHKITKAGVDIFLLNSRYKIQEQWTISQELIITENNMIQNNYF